MLSLDIHNQQNLEHFPGQAKTYQAVDEGDRKFLKKILAPKVKII